MGLRDLRDFLRLLEERDALVRVAERVSSDLEITALADRAVKSGGPALLFENVEGSELPVAINLYGTRQRMAWALGVDTLDDITTRLRNLMDVKLGGGLFGMASNLPKLRELASLPPRRVTRAPVQEVVWRGEEVDLAKLPVLRCWPQDGGPFVTLPLVITKDPIARDVNIGMYRMQVLGKAVTAMHWQRHKTGARHLASARERGERLEVAVALGGDPALTYAATAPIPPIPGVNEYSLTGFLRGRRVELVKAISVDLEVPAHAEIVLEGYVDPEAPWVTEGPFGDHTGFYTLQDMYPSFVVTTITMRRDAIYPATIVGRPPMEDAFLIEASERIFLVPAQLILPEIVDYHMPPAGIAHNLVNVRITKSYPGQAYKVANGLLGLGQMMFAKVVLVSDADVRPQDHLEFWRAVLRNAVPGRDEQFAKGPIDVLDHASRAWSYGSKLVIDGTSKHREEGGAGRGVGAPETSGVAQGTTVATEPNGWEPNPERGVDELPDHAEILDQHQVAGGFWFIATRKTRPDQGRHLGEWAARQGVARGVRLIAVVDHETDPRDFEDVMWTMLNNIDPERDVQVVTVDAPGGGAWVFDATPKGPAEGFTRPWPDKIVMPDEITERMAALAERHGF
ncbi:MAG: menaquinone biosynthesis decarboxylase [Trueperaceae bacterium]|nr:menaquinone biosynthesis decarboxylase [Trueperaceae bacterium]